MGTVQKQTSLVNEFAKQIKLSVTELGLTMSDSEVEALAIFLIRTMGSDSRDYHRPEHSLEVSRVKDPIPRLAAFFHDVIYVQVDPTWRELSQLIYPFIPDNSFSLNVVDALKQANDPWLRAVCMMFGVEHEETLTPSKGLNEFLSALLMYQKLKGHLKPEIMFRAVACVIATVPFLGIDAEGKNPAERLVVRMKSATKALEFGPFPESFYDEMVNECCEIVHTDLASFGSALFEAYISNTWKVMYESYPPLRNMYFSISEYRRAVYGNITFLDTLDSSRLFWDVYSKGRKADKVLDGRSNYNLRMGQIYLKSIGVALSVLEAIALLTGGDAPYEMFTGAMRRSREHNPIAIDEFLPSPETLGGAEIEEVIYTVLKDGRGERARFDGKTNALAAYLFYELKCNGVLALYQKTKLMHNGGLSAEAFLKEVPEHVLKKILAALEKVVLTRQSEFKKIQN